MTLDQAQEKLLMAVIEKDQLAFNLYSRLVQELEQFTDSKSN